jgi:hypothetical protein
MKNPKLKADAEFLSDYYTTASMIAYYLTLVVEGRPISTLRKQVKGHMRELKRLEKRMGRLFQANGELLDPGLRL